MRKCSYCGATLPENTRFCGACGSVQDALATENEEEERRGVPPWSLLPGAALTGEVLLDGGQAAPSGTPGGQTTPQVGSAPSATGSPNLNTHVQGPVHQPMPKAVNQPASHPTQGPAHQLVHRPTQGPTHQPVTHSMREPLSHPASERPGTQQSHERQTIRERQRGSRASRVAGGLSAKTILLVVTALVVVAAGGIAAAVHFRGGSSSGAAQTGSGQTSGSTSSGKPSGSIIEFTLPSSHGYPGNITTGPDGNLWFTETTDSRQDLIGHMTPTGTATAFPFTSSSNGVRGLASIIAGPDGNLWFLETQAGMVGRITPSGSITEFPLPNPTSGPSGLTVGPDGNLWFTEQDASNIGRITPGGAITEFPTPVYGNTGITAGPDGNLWFANALNAEIGQMTPAGNVSLFPLPAHGKGDAGSGFMSLTVGPDHTLWFVDSIQMYTVGPMIGHMTLTGAVTEFPVPAPYTANSRLYVLITGQDGNLWFISPTEDQIGRMTPTGTLKVFPLPAADSGQSSVSGMTNGPDGNIWFTEGGTKKIAYVVVEKQ